MKTHAGLKFAHNPITRLNAMLHRRTHMYFDRALRPYGLAFTHFRMLAFIARSDGVKQEDVRAYIDGDKGGVAHAVKRLVEKGYVVRERNPEDGRAYVVRVTPQGRELLEELAELGRTWSDQMIAGFSDSEQQLAEDLLQRMADNVCALLGEDCEDARA